MPKCTKKKLDKVTASIAIRNPNRGEIRFYYCLQCCAYHLTSLPNVLYEKRVKSNRLELYLSRGEQRMLMKILNIYKNVLDRGDKTGTSKGFKVLASLNNKLKDLLS